MKTDVTPASRILTSATLQSVMDNVGAFIYIKDLDGRYIYANQQALDLFRLSLDEFVGAYDSDLFDLERSNELRENDQRVIESAQVVEKEEINYIKETGEERIYWSVKQPLYDESGTMVGMYGISTDITDRKRMENEVQRQNRLLEAIMGNVEAHIYVKNSERRFGYVNRQVCEASGRSVDEIYGMRDVDVFGRETADMMWKSDARVFATGERQMVKEPVIDSTGRQSFYWSIKVPLNLDSDPKTLIGFSTDITEQHELQERLRLESIQDALTGLYNRRYFFECAEREFATAARKKRCTGMVAIDLDYFKEINDRYGHPEGDRILEKVGKLISEITRTGDVLARIGGEEFAVLVPDSHIDEVRELAERIRSRVRSTVFSTRGIEKAEVTVSVGVAVDSDSSADVQALYAAADRKLYLAKHSGRDRVCS